MAKKYAGFKSEARAEKYPMLPAGTYVAGIKNVKVDGAEPDQQLVLRLDIIEGDWTGYYTKRYDHDTQNAGFQQNYQAKYKGDLRIQIPDDRNTMRQHKDWDEKTFNNAMYAIERSNPGIVFNWDQIFAGDFVFLKGKTVGLNVREGNYNGNPYTQPGRLEVADDVRKGLVKTMPPKKDSVQATAVPTPAQEGYGFTPVETDELPF